MTVRILLSVLILFAFIRCTTESAEFDVREITHKLPEEVEVVMGKPDSAYFQTVVTKKFYTHQYHQIDGKFDVEIQYINGRSDDIIITDIVDDHPYDTKVLSLFGLPDIAPSETFENGYFKWRDFEGYHVINMYATHLDEAGVVDDYKIFFKAAKE